jgi:hypothetical protein
MRTSFHHQPEAQHPHFQLFASWQADYPIYWRHSGHARSVANLPMRRDTDPDRTLAPDDQRVMKGFCRPVAPAPTLAELALPLSSGASKPERASGASSIG